MTKRVNGSLDFYHLWVDHKSVIKDYAACNTLMLFKLLSIFRRYLRRQSALMEALIFTEIGQNLKVEYYFKIMTLTRNSHVLDVWVKGVI